MNAPLYTTEILRLAASLPEPVEFERTDGEAEERSPTCGSTVRASVQIDADGKVAALSQKVHACAFGQASAALLDKHSVGRSHDDVTRALEELRAWLAGEGEPPQSWPGLAALQPALPRRSRHPAILLPFRALAAAMKAAGR